MTGMFRRRENPRPKLREGGRLPLWFDVLLHFTLAFAAGAFWGALVFFGGAFAVGVVGKSLELSALLWGPLSFALLAVPLSVVIAYPAFALGYCVSLLFVGRGVQRLWQWMLTGLLISVLTLVGTGHWANFAFLLLFPLSGTICGYFAWRQFCKDGDFADRHTRRLRRKLEREAQDKFRRATVLHLPWQKILSSYSYSYFCSVFIATAVCLGVPFAIQEMKEDDPVSAIYTLFGLAAVAMPVSVLFNCHTFVLGYLVSFSYIKRGITSRLAWIATGVAIAALAFVAIQHWHRYGLVLHVLCGALVGEIAWRQFFDLRYKDRASSGAPATQAVRQSMVAAKPDVMDAAESAGRLRRLPLRDYARLRRYAWIFLIVSVLTTTLGGLNAIYKRYNPVPPYVLAARERSLADGIELNIHDVRFRIPRSYLYPGSPHVDGEKTTSILLSVELPDITRQSRPSGEYFKKGPPHRLTRVLIDAPLNADGSPRKTLPERLDSLSRSYRTSVQAPDVHGLHHLTQPSGHDPNGEEIFFEGNPSNPETFIRCGKLGPLRTYPGCHMQFQFRSLVVEVDFRRTDWLPQWRKIKATTIKRLDEFFLSQVDSADEASSLQAYPTSTLNDNQKGD